MSIGMSLGVIGIKRLKKVLDEAEINYMSAVAGAVYESGNRIVAKSVKKAPVAPKFGGFLRGSVYQTFPQRIILPNGKMSKTAHNFSTTIGFNATYARKVETTARDPSRRLYFTSTFNEVARGHKNFVVARAKANYTAGRGLKKASNIPDRYFPGGTKRKYTHYRGGG